MLKPLLYGCEVFGAKAGFGLCHTRQGFDDLSFTV
jgi:hypothetical protein